MTYCFPHTFPKAVICKLAMGLVFVVLTGLSSSFKFISTYETKASLLTVDNFSNFYSASDYGIIRYSPDGKFICRYEEFKYGKIGMVDVVNPMKILVFYPDFMTVVRMDRFLSPLNVYNFFDLGYQNISAVASSTDGRVWFYDNIEFKLKKIDETGKVFRESQPLNVVLEQTPNPNFMLEKDNLVYMNDPEIGILVFDVFGSYSKTIPLKGLRKFQILQEQVVYFDNYRLNSYNSATLEFKTLSLPDTTAVNLAVLEKDRLGIMKKDRIDFYMY